MLQPEVVAHRCSAKTCWLATLSKKRLCHRCFPVNFCEISMNTFSYRTLPVAASVQQQQQQLLQLQRQYQHPSQQEYHHYMYQSYQQNPQ